MRLTQDYSLQFKLLDHLPTFYQYVQSAYSNQTLSPTPHVRPALGYLPAAHLNDGLVFGLAEDGRVVVGVADVDVNLGGGAERRLAHVGGRHLQAVAGHLGTRRGIT